MHNSSGWVTFDLSCVIEVLNFKNFATNSLINSKIKPILNHGWRSVVGYRISIN